MLEVKNISYDVEENGEKIVILNNISATFNENETIVITGHNGSGKSTLAKIIMGIIKPTNGKILFDNQDITNLSITERANLGISFSFQHPIKFKGLIVKDLLDIALAENSKLDMACEYLSVVGLCARNYINRELNDKLSGGELKRIEIALTFARNAKINIFDEPEAGIDLWSFEKLINAFNIYHIKNKATTIIVSHQDKILSIADKILVLNGGKLEVFGTKDEVFPIISQGCHCMKRYENE